MALAKANVIRNGILIAGLGLVIVTVWFKWQPDLAWQQQLILISSYELYAFIGVSFLGAIVLCLLQWFASYANTEKRKQLYWVITAWMVAPVVYIIFYMVPMAGDHTPILSRSMTWAVMALCYALIVVVIRRFALLYLDQHLQRATKWVAHIILLLMLDMLVLWLVYINRDLPLVGLLVLILWGYVPLRFMLKRYLDSHLDEQGDGAFRSAVSYLFRQFDQATNNEPWPIIKWPDLLVHAFQPMSVSETQDTRTSRLINNGQTLHVKGNAFSPALQINHAQGGARLFTNEDLNLINTLHFMFEQTQQFKSAFIAGQTEERQRIRRDLHDQIGFQLVSIIYSNDVNMSRVIAKNTLAELRLLIKALQPKLTKLNNLLIDLKTLSDDFCQLAEMDLHWFIAGSIPDLNISGRQYVNLVSAVRELLVNVQRHAQAEKVAINIAIEGRKLTIHVHDNGNGITEKNQASGNGISNLMSRVNELHGTITWENEAGTLASICVPI